MIHRRSTGLLFGLSFPFESQRIQIAYFWLSLMSPAYLESSPSEIPIEFQQLAVKHPDLAISIMRIK